MVVMEVPLRHFSNECPINDKSDGEATAGMKVTMQRIAMLHHEIISEQQDSTACIHTHTCIQYM